MQTWTPVDLCVSGAVDFCKSVCMILYHTPSSWVSVTVMQHLMVHVSCKVSNIDFNFNSTMGNHIWLLCTFDCYCSSHSKCILTRTIIYILIMFICRRGLNPPHRVKSISMTTFSPAEIQALKNGGNEVSILSALLFGFHIGCILWHWTTCRVT